MSAVTVAPKGVRLDPDLLADVKRFGAADVSACFSCGTCTAICPLSDNDGTFPRRIIRYAQLGMQEALVSSKELWVCYHCGTCSESCPTQADPAGFMAAARRYAVASYDRTRLARTLFTRPAVGAAIATAIAAFFALFMYASHGAQSATQLALFDFIPEPLIHRTGVAVMVLVALAAVAGVASMARGIARREQVGWSDVLGGRQAWRRSLRALWTALGVEALGQRRYRADCGEAQQSEPLYRRRWLLHALTLWGFLGLFLATILDYGLALAGIKATGTPVPIWYPVRLLGTVAGAAMVYGTTLLIWNRLRHANRTAAESRFSDWLLLALLWVTGVTGFGIELALYLPHAPAWGYWGFLVHVAVAIELVLLIPFTKLAHAIYRPVALFFHTLAGERAAGAD
ncbi:MAG: respiratory nitrate reductase subunit gamma [Gemmatimonadota bacterium]|nr:respiratory nitrate reductase subunit gamma [Gemmatimonadota bacterium]